MLRVLKACASDKATECFKEIMGRMLAVSGVALISLHIIKYENAYHPSFDGIHAAKLALAFFLVFMTVWVLHYIKKNYSAIYRCAIIRARMLGKTYTYFVFCSAVPCAIAAWFWMFASQYSNIVAEFFARGDGRPVMALMGVHVLTFMGLMFLYFMCVADRRCIDLFRTCDRTVISNKAPPSEAMMPSSNRSYDAGTRP